jgi:hypothetical protein
MRRLFLSRNIEGGATDAGRVLDFVGHAGGDAAALHRHAAAGELWGLRTQLELGVDVNATLTLTLGGGGGGGRQSGLPLPPGPAPLGCEGATALHWASSGGHASAVALLLAARADPGARAPGLGGATALHLAAEHSAAAAGGGGGGAAAVLELLLVGGAPLQAVSAARRLAQGRLTAAYALTRGPAATSPSGGGGAGDLRYAGGGGGGEARRQRAGGERHGLPASVVASVLERAESSRLPKAATALDKANEYGGHTAVRATQLTFN